MRAELSAAAPQMPAGAGERARMIEPLRTRPWIELYVAPRDIELAKDPRTRGLFICTSIAFAPGCSIRVVVRRAVTLDARIVAAVSEQREICSRCNGSRRGMVVQANSIDPYESLVDLLHRSEQRTSDL
jgi:hypothetical protein